MIEVTHEIVLKEKMRVMRNRLLQLGAVGWVLGALLLCSCSQENPMETDRGGEPVASDPVAAPVVGPEIGWISLSPRLSLPTSLDDPPETGWPEPGRVVRWQAHVLNRAGEMVADAGYSWHIDGDSVVSGKIDLQTGETVIELSRPWTFTREEIAFTVKVESADGRTASDRISVVSNALSVGLWVEQAIYDWLAAEADLPAFEQLARKEVENWNKILSRSMDFNGGVIDRLRLDRVVVLPTGSPFPLDQDTDLVWYFNSRAAGVFLHVGSSPVMVKDQTIILHELLHQRGINDLYAYDIFHLTDNGSDVGVLDPDGSQAAGGARMPSLRNVPGGGHLLYTWDPRTLMSTDYRSSTRLTPHSIYGLNLVAGCRTPRWIDEWGNVVNPLMSGQPEGNPYATHVPERVELLMMEPEGEPLAGVTVDLFFDQGQFVYQDVYRAEPDVTLETDSSGVAILQAGQLWADPTWRKRKDSNVLIVRARTSGDTIWGYAFLKAYDLNVAFIQGNQELARIAVPVKLQ